MNALQSAVDNGDTIVVGTGSTAQTVTAGNNVRPRVDVGQHHGQRPVRQRPRGHVGLRQHVLGDAGGPDRGVALNLQATKNPGGQPTGYQSLAYFFSPGYSATVG